MAHNYFNYNDQSFIFILRNVKKTCKTCKFHAITQLYFSKRHNVTITILINKILLELVFEKQIFQKKI